MTLTLSHITIWRQRLLTVDKKYVCNSRITQLYRVVFNVIAKSSLSRRSRQQCAKTLFEPAFLNVLRTDQSCRRTPCYFNFHFETKRTKQLMQRIHHIVRLTGVEFAAVQRNQQPQKISRRQLAFVSWKSHRENFNRGWNQHKYIFLIAHRWNGRWEVQVLQCDERRIDKVWEFYRLRSQEWNATSISAGSFRVSLLSEKGKRQQFDSKIDLTRHFQKKTRQFGGFNSLLSMLSS